MLEDSTRWIKFQGGSATLLKGRVSLPQASKLVGASGALDQTLAILAPDAKVICSGDGMKLRPLRIEVLDLFTVGALYRPRSVRARYRPT